MQKFVTITNEDIYKKITEIEKVAAATLEQAKYTNGRVNKLEEVTMNVEANQKEIDEMRRTSLWLWISTHPFKFTAFVMLAISILQVDLELLLSKIF